MKYFQKNEDHNGVCFIVLFLALLFAMQPGLAQERVPTHQWVQYSSSKEAGWSAEGISNAKAYADSIGTASFMLIHDGAVVTTFGDYTRRYMCHSVRKSLLSGLMGIYVEEGAIDLEQTVGELGIKDRTPLSEMEKQARVIDLLKARSGVYHPAAYESQGMAARRPERGSHEPGTFWYYNNWDFNTLGTIFRQETGEDLFEAFNRRIAEPLKMQDFRLRDGYYHKEPEHSTHPAYPFRMSARDLARYGLLFERKGRWGSEQLIPATWVENSIKAYSKVDDPALNGVGGYGYMWWLLDGQLGDYGTYTALGVGTQTITVVPDLDLVFVHRVNTYEGDRVQRDNIFELLNKLIEARDHKVALNPEFIALDEPSPALDAVRLPTDVRKEYTGTYNLASGLVIDVTYQNNQLILYSNRFGTYGLIPLSRRQFLIEDVNETMFFAPTDTPDSVALISERLLAGEAAVLNRKGQAEEALEMLKQAVTYYPASAETHQRYADGLITVGDTSKAYSHYLRSFELNPANIGTEWKLMQLGAEGFSNTRLSPAQLESYVGEYKNGNIEMSVTKVDGQLFLAISDSNEPKPLIARSEDTFIQNHPDKGVLKLIFVEEEDSQVGEVKVIRTSGSNLQLQKVEQY